MTRYLVFDQNTITTRNKFLSIVNPYLAGVQQAQGLSAFRVVMDETNNTPDLIDRNILYGQLFLPILKAVFGNRDIVCSWWQAKCRRSGRLDFAVYDNLCT